MFGFLRSENSKLRGAAKNWLYLGSKVYNFRRDELSDSEISELGQRMNELRSLLKAKTADAGKLKLAIEGVEGHLGKIGGAFYPQSMFSENVDFLLYGLIIYLGFTAFFIKLFEIPTNSMWPSYNGMTSEVWRDENEAPGGLKRVFRMAALGATRSNLTAPRDGELLIPVVVNGVGRIEGLAKSAVSKRHHLVIPGKGVGYVFEIGGETLVFKVPNDFDLEIPMPIDGAQKDSVLGTAWFPDEPSFWEAIQKRIAAGQIDRRGRLNLADGSSVEVAWIKSGLSFKKGEHVLSFDIHVGDRLFVDRMSYHFAKPKVGDGFVFLTSEVEGLKAEPETYYVKRLSGVEGDRMKIENGRLFVNGEEPQGSVAFHDNNEKVAPYDGYFNIGDRLLRRGETIAVPEGRYVALGDNSGNSKDSRAWGYVPQKAVVGRPVMIWYPFTKRFGPTK